MQLRALRNPGLRGKGNAGFTMAEAIIAVGILGIIVYTSMGMWKTVAGIKIKLNIESDRIDVGLALRDRIDCSKTLAAFSPSICDAASENSPVAVPLKDSSDQTIVASSTYAPTAVTSTYQAKATCYKDGDYYIFNANILVPSPSNQDVKVFKNIGYVCWKPAVPPPLPPPDPPPTSCYAMGGDPDTPPCAAMFCPMTFKACYYNGSTVPSFRFYKATADCVSITCPGTPTDQRCITSSCPEF